MKEAIKDYLSAELLIDFDGDLDDDTDLFQAGVIDSHSYIHLIRFLESTFDIRFTEEELLSGVTATVAGLVELVEDKQQATNAAD